MHSHANQTAIAEWLDLQTDTLKYHEDLLHAVTNMMRREIEIGDVLGLWLAHPHEQDAKLLQNFGVERKGDRVVLVAY